MLRYAITADPYTPGTAARLAAEGIEYLQLRAKSLDAGALAGLARSILAEIATVPQARTRLLINGRADVAAAVAASSGTPVGVHLTSDVNELTPAQVRRVFSSLGNSLTTRCLVSVSCHTLAEVAAAHADHADFILFGPVFEKRVANLKIQDGSGLDLLRHAVVAAAGTPVLALGGITADNAADCMAAGAAGIAAIRLFAGS